MQNHTLPSHYFIKGDISGIQDFIFNVKSEKAARVLKARSMFIQILGWVAESKLKERLKAAFVELKEDLYNGGGTFYFYATSTKELKELEIIIQEEEVKINQVLTKQDIYVSLSCFQIKSQHTFKDYWEGIARKSNIDKLQKYANSYSEFQSYTDDIDELDWLSFAHKFPKLESELKTDNLKEISLKVYKKSIKLFDRKLSLKKEPSINLFEDQIQDKLPQWRNVLYHNPEYNRLIKEHNLKEPDSEICEEQIIDYHFLAYFAEQRTGTKKIAILKMDVDNLGIIFNSISDKQKAKEISKYFADFFEVRMYELLKEPIHSALHCKEHQPYQYQDNIYTIFSGGDDCFFVGAWDTIFQWAHLVQDRFKNELAQKLTEKVGLPVSLSGGIVLVEPTYPVIRFADLAESALEKAKRFKYWDQALNAPEKEATKNKVCVLGEVLSWCEYSDAMQKAFALEEMLVPKEKNQSGAARSILERIRSTAEDYKVLQEEALAGKGIGPRVAKLFYYIRHAKNKEWLKEQIIEPYSEDLMDAFTKYRKINPMKYPVAARWAEFLTRNNL